MQTADVISATTLFARKVRCQPPILPCNTDIPASRLPHSFVELFTGKIKRIRGSIFTSTTLPHLLTFQVLNPILPHYLFSSRRSQRHSCTIFSRNLCTENFRTTDRTHFPHHFSTQQTNIELLLSIPVAGYADAEIKDRSPGL